MTLGCREPDVQSSPDQRGVHFTITHVAVHWWWVTAHLYRKQISIGVIAVTLGCCEPDVQSSPEQRGVHFTMTRVALHWWWVTAHLYKQ